jgi:hypothetical protein
MKHTKTVQSYKDTAHAKNRSSLDNTRTGFADRDRIKEQNKMDNPKDSFKSMWDFRCPQYDQRSSNFVNAGTHYGIAMKQPIGHEGNPKEVVAALPRHRMNTLQDDDLG